MATVQARRTNCVLKDVVLLYPHLFKPHKIPNTDNDPKFGTVVLLPKGYDLTPLHEIMLAAAQSKFGETTGKDLLATKKVKLPLRKQNEMAEKGSAGFSDQEGDLFFNAQSESQPGIVDGRREPILDPDRIYSGVICNVQVQCYGWDHPLSGKGLSFDLQNVQRVKDGPKLANAKPDPTKAFDELDEPDVDLKPSDDADAGLKSIFGR